MSVVDQPPSRARAASLASRLVRLGFTDPAAAEHLLASSALGSLESETLLPEALSVAADPDAALRGLVALAEAVSDRGSFLATLAASKPLRDRLFRVFGVSVALAEHLARHPDEWHGLVAFDVDDVRPTPEVYRSALLAAVRSADRADGPPAGSPPDGAPLDALRREYRRLLFGIAARDVCGTADVSEVAADLSNLAGATLEAALEVARGQLPEDAAPCRLAVIAMGKCGGCELNYVSDVDVVFVAEPDGGAREEDALRTATRLATWMMRACSDVTAEGCIWPVDAALRPEGKAGPLVRTLASHRAYYQRWAKTWEFQALLKARPAAGDAELGRRYLEEIAPLVWNASSREHFVADVQAMRRRVVDQIPYDEADRELKLGPGGLRDIEFAVQLLQLVHGRSDPEIRSANTFAALRSLAACGYVGRADAAALEEAYAFLRQLEHRLQLYRLRRTHTIPTDESELRRLGRALGYTADPVEELRAEWRRHAQQVRRLHEKLFYRPLLEAVARLPAEHARLSPQAARTRLEALGYADPAGALRHLEALTTGVSRRAAIQRTLLPVMLGWFADAPDPDAGLLAFRQVSDALGSTPWYLRLLRDEGAAAERMARILSSGRFATELLLRAPDAVALLGTADGLRPRRRDAVEPEVLAAVRRAADSGSAVAVVRSIRRRELYRIAAADLLDEDDVDGVGEALTAIAAATLTGALEAATRAETARRGGAFPTRIAVIAMGRLGGHEMGYGSDADVLFVHEPLAGAREQEAAEAAFAVANEMRDLLAVPSTEPPLVVDANLRPEGRQGPLVRTLASYAAYYERWSHVWESQALLRAEPVAGDVELGKAFMGLIDPIRYPAGGLEDGQVREVRRIKARVESERLPRGVEPALHTKLGPGGLADVEWTVQLLQLRHAARIPDLRTTRTRAALAAAAGAGLLAEAEAAVLDDAWVEATLVRNAVTLVRGRPADTLPTELRELAGVGRLLGLGTTSGGSLTEQYRRMTRRARAVVEHVFYG